MQHASSVRPQGRRTRATRTPPVPEQAGSLVSQGRRGSPSAGADPALGIGPLLETHAHDVGAILRESMEHEESALALHRQLLRVVGDRSSLLEDDGRRMIAEEEPHLGEVDQLLRNAGDLESFGTRGTSSTARVVPRPLRS